MFKPFFLLLCCVSLSGSLLAQQAPPREELHRQDIPTPMDSIYRWRITQEKLGGVYIPKDLYDCFKQLDKLMDADVKAKFLAFKDEEVDGRCHLNIGQWIGFKWELADGSRLSAYFNKMGVPHPDYMISIILVSYHRNLLKQDLKLKEQVEAYKKDWTQKQAELIEKLRKGE